MHLTRTWPRAPRPAPRDAATTTPTRASHVNTALEQLNLEWNQIWEDGKVALSKCRSTKRFINVDGGLPNSGMQGWKFV